MHVRIGALLNYSCVGAAVFSGAWAAAGGEGSAGDVAARVSLASFYMLMLIYSFTQASVCGRAVV